MRSEVLARMYEHLSDVLFGPWDWGRDMKYRTRTQIRQAADGSIVAVTVFEPTGNADTLRKVAGLMLGRTRDGDAQGDKAAGAHEDPNSSR